MVGQRIINNILGNSPKVDRRSKNKKYDIIIDGSHVRYGKSYVYADSIQEAVKKAKEVYPRGQNVTVDIDDIDDFD